MAKTAFHTHTFNTKRLASRRAAIARVFSETSMETAWKKYVRSGLRNQEVLDLHDFNDFHWDRQQIFAKLHTALCSGRYTPQRSVPVHVEKRLGVTRTLVLPTPEDCVVLQCIVEAILPAALKKQPSANSFFSRSHGFQAPAFKFEKDYVWFRQWVKFASTRFEMITNHSHVCVTDIANYFDNIDYSNLRNILSTINDMDEVTLDILFSVLDKISWRPDYLPSPEKSLPQVNFDAPRLLSHVYLYEVDAFLKKETGNKFVRWVDDMTITVGSRAAGKGLLRDLDHLLMTRGLRLNAGKTQILSAAEARRFFHSVENAFLDEVKSRLGNPGLSARRRERILSTVRARFDAFRAKAHYGQSDKIIKRYLTHFSAHSDDHAVKYTLATITSEPGLRENAFRYFQVLGVRRDTLSAMRDYLRGPDLLDDASLMQIAKTLTEWRIKPNSRLHRDIRALGEEIGDRAFIERNPFFLVASLWILAKYGLRKHILPIINNSFEVWSHSEFLARQVASVYSKFRAHREGEILRSRIERLKFSSVNSVFNSFDRLQSNLNSIKVDHRLYVLNGRNISTYSIQRFLTCLHILSSIKTSAPVRRALRTDVLKYVDDPIYANVIQKLRI